MREGNGPPAWPSSQDRFGCSRRRLAAPLSLMRRGCGRPGSTVRRTCRGDTSVGGPLWWCRGTSPDLKVPSGHRGGPRGRQTSWCSAALARRRTARCAGGGSAEGTQSHLGSSALRGRGPQCRCPELWRSSADFPSVVVPAQQQVSCGWTTQPSARPNDSSVDFSGWWRGLLAYQTSPGG